MTITNSTLAQHVIKTCGINLGQLYFFNNIVISEIKEGIHVTFENSQELIEAIKDYFGSSRPFGMVSNMINSYSVNLTDSEKFKEELKNLSAYAMVTYNAAGKLNAEIASNFCKVKDEISFDDLYKAADTVYNKVKQVKIPVD